MATQRAKSRPRTTQPQGSRNATRRSRRSARPYSGRIQERREELGLTQEELARRAGVSVKTVCRAENGQNVDLEFLNYLAQALGLTYREIAAPASANGDDPEFWLDEIERADREGDLRNACRLGEALVEELLSPTHPLYRRACVRLAIVYDHYGQWEDALAVLDRSLAGADQGSRSEERLWAVYQRGVIRQAYAKDLLSRTGWRFTNEIRQLLEQAESDLHTVSRNKHEGLAVAARHQLGVLAILRKKYSRALEIFQACLKQRENGTDPSGELAASFRLAYEHRRIGQCFALRASAAKNNQQRKRDRHSARRHLTQAQRLARQCNHIRLLRDVNRDFKAWGLAPI